MATMDDLWDSTSNYNESDYGTYKTLREINRLVKLYIYESNCYYLNWRRHEVDWFENDDTSRLRGRGEHCETEKKVNLNKEDHVTTKDEVIRKISHISSTKFDDRCRLISDDTKVREL